LIHNLVLRLNRQSLQLDLQADGLSGKRRISLTRL